MLLARAVGSGTLTLDTRVNTLLPVWSRLPPPHGDAVTLRHLATHTSGLPRMPVSASQCNVHMRAYTLWRLYNDLPATPISHSPGTAYVYSNLAVGLLGHLVARATGAPSVGVALRHGVFRPLRMATAAVSGARGAAAGRPLPGQAVPHNPDGQPVPPLVLTTALAAAGAVAASVADVAAFASFVLTAAVAPAAGVAGAAAATVAAVGRNGTAARGGSGGSGVADDEAAALRSALRLTATAQTYRRTGRAVRMYGPTRRDRQCLGWADSRHGATPGRPGVLYHGGATDGSSAFLSVDVGRGVAVGVLGSTRSPAVVNLAVAVAAAMDAPQWEPGVVLGGGGGSGALPPPPPVVVALSAAALGRLTGTYRYGTATARVWVEEGGGDAAARRPPELWARPAAGASRLRLYPADASGLRFTVRATEVRVDFWEERPGGRVGGAVLRRAGRRLPLWCRRAGVGEGAGGVRARVEAWVVEALLRLGA